MKMVLSGGKEIVVTPDNFRTYWKRMKENTSSSASGLHYGHYKAAVHSDMLSKVLAQHITIITRSGIPPERWSVALQVMLEKVVGTILVSKLRSIQLYEADFNFFNKFVFGRLSQQRLEETGFLPREHYSQKQSTAEDATFDKTLTTDISRLMRWAMVLMCIDAAQCYDRVYHVIMCLMWYALLRNDSAINIALQCLSTMQFHQRTGFGDSVSFFGGPQIATPFCGLGQGSGGSPASWIQLSSMIVNAYTNLGFGAKIPHPTTHMILASIGCLFVDDTDLFVMDPSLSKEDLWRSAQESVEALGRLLIATGGTPKSEKCCGYFVDYECSDGEWTIVGTLDQEIIVPMSNGSYFKLDCRPVNEAEKMIGVMSEPAGGSAAHLEAVKDKAKSWTNKMTNGYLPAAWSWVSYCIQL